MENSFIEEAVASAELTKAFEPPEGDDLSALNQLVEEYTGKEAELAKVESELVTRDEQFANFITTQKRLKEQKEVLTDLIKEYMTEHNLTEHETDTVVLKLSPSGKYKAENLEEIPDNLCEIKRTLSNKAVKAYLQLNGHLPEGIKSTGSILRIKVKETE